MTVRLYELSDHSDHDRAPGYDQMLADHIDDARPVVEALEAHGWSDVLLDPGIDCEAPTAPDAVDVFADVPAGELGTLRVRARVVRGRAATLNDVLQVVGGAQLGAQISMLVADEVDEKSFGRFPIPRDVLRIRTLADVGLAGL